MLKDFKQNVLVIQYVLYIFRSNYGIIIQRKLDDFEISHLIRVEFIVVLSVKKRINKVINQMNQCDCK